MPKPIYYDIPPGTEPTRCRYCDRMIYWTETAKGKRIPVHVDGTNHIGVCPGMGKKRS